MTRGRLLAGLPVRQRRVDAAGVATALLEGGGGPPLVPLHGGIECGGVYWAPVIARLVAHHRVIVPDAPELGESAPLDRLDDERFARWLGLRIVAAWFDSFSTATRSHATVPHVKRTMRALLEIGTARVPDAELRRIGFPATLLWGRYDRMIPPALEQPDSFVNRLSALPAASSVEAVG